jgi:HrpA-like RNA helicase
LFNSNNFDRRSTLECDQYQLACTSTFASNQCITGKLSQIIPQIPPDAKINPAMIQFRNQLIISRYQQQFLDAVDQHQVVLVTGESGVGKSTQIPQFILEECNRLQRNCCVVSSQPTRIDALGLADRISIERGEQLGQTIGFQIRLESK